MAADKIPISVIVPVYNESSSIEECLTALINQKGMNFPDDYELIVVDDGSTDDSVKKIEKYPVRLIRLDKNCGRIYTRKTGAENAGHRTLLFLDPRFIASNDLLESFQRVRYTPLIAGVNLRLEKDLTNPEVRFFFLIRRRYYYPYYPPDKKKGFVYITESNFNKVPKGTGCLFIQKELFLEAIPEKFTKHTSDDTKLFDYIVFKKHIPILQHCGIKIYYKHRSDSKETVKMVIRRGVTYFDFYVRNNLFLKISILLVNSLFIFLFFCLIINPFCLLYGAGIGLAVYIGITLFIIERPRDIFIVFTRLGKYLFYFYFGLMKGWILKDKKP